MRWVGSWLPRFSVPADRSVSGRADGRSQTCRPHSPCSARAMSASFSTTALISGSVIRRRVLLAVLLGCPALAGLKARPLGFGLGDPAGHCCRACADVEGSPALVQLAVALGGLSARSARGWRFGPRWWRPGRQGEPDHHLRLVRCGDLLDVVPGSQTGHLIRFGSAGRALEQRHELVEVVLVPSGYRGLEEDLGRLASRVAECVRDTWGTNIKAPGPPRRKRWPVPDCQ